jgi:hypothetical protein
VPDLWRRVPWPIVALLGWCLAGAFGVAAGIQCVELDNRHLNFQWGNAAEWAAGIGTVLAFGATLFVFSYQTGEQRRADRRKQAEQIFAYWDFPAKNELVVINGSTGVVYGIVLILEYSVRNHPEVGRKQTAYAGERRLPPGVTRTYPVEFRSIAGEPVRPSQIDRGWTLTTCFTDQAGVDWLRTDDGKLGESQENPSEFGSRKNAEQKEHDELHRQHDQQMYSERASQRQLRERIQQQERAALPQPQKPARRGGGTGDAGAPLGRRGLLSATAAARRGLGWLRNQRGQ